MEGLASGGAEWAGGRGPQRDPRSGSANPGGSGFISFFRDSEARERLKQECIAEGTPASGIALSKKASVAWGLLHEDEQQRWKQVAKEEAVAKAAGALWANSLGCCTAVSSLRLASAGAGPPYMPALQACFPFCRLHTALLVQHQGWSWR